MQFQLGKGIVFFKIIFYTVVVVATYVTKTNAAYMNNADRVILSSQFVT